MVKFAFGSDSTGHVVLDNLEFLEMVLRKIEVQRVAIIKFGLDKRGCYYTGSV